MSKIQGQHVPVEQKNFAINGALDFWQDKAGNTTTINTASTQSTYAADMTLVISIGSSVKNYSYVRSTDVPTVAQSGFQSTYSQLFTMITGIPSLAASDRVEPFQYRMEGNDYAKIHGKNVTFGFWVKASAAGIYNFAMSNSAETRSYVTTFNINSANTYEFKSITVQMDSSGTWLFDNSGVILIRIGSVSGSTTQTSSLNQWQNGIFTASTTQTNWIGTSGATLRIAQFSIVEGTLGFGATGFQRAGKSIQQEMSMCQRYYYNLSGGASGVSALASSTTATWVMCKHPVRMRTAPALSGTTGTYALNGGAGNFISSSTTPATGASDIDGAIWTVSGFTGLTTNGPYQTTPAGAPTGTYIADARL